MSFRFPYDRILSMKEKETEHASKQLHELMQRRKRIEEEYHSINAVRDEKIRSWEEWKAPLKVTEIHDHNVYVDMLEKRIHDLQQTLEKIDEEIGQQRQYLSERKQEEKAWKDWKEKLRVQYEEKIRQQEQAMLDEMATLRYFRSYYQS
jgi:flagellar FliJ protein